MKIIKPLTEDKNTNVQNQSMKKVVNREILYMKPWEDGVQDIKVWNSAIDELSEDDAKKLVNIAKKMSLAVKKQDWTKLNMLSHDMESLEQQLSLRDNDGYPISVRNKNIKEDLDNLERVQGRQTVQGIMMKDAEEQSKKSEDNFKEVAGNPEDVKKKKPFISGEKQPKPKDVETPKPELEESLFEEDIDDSTSTYKYAYSSLMSIKRELKRNINSLSISQLAGILTTAMDIVNIVDDAFKNNNKTISNESVKLRESGGMGDDGILYSTDGEPFTFWDKIYAELDGNLHPQENDYVKLSEIPVKSRNDKYQEISVTNDGNIRVFAPTKDKLNHAIKVANHYGLDYEAGASTGYTDPGKAFYCTIKIPEEKQDEYVTYDARPDVMSKWLERKNKGDKSVA